MRDSGQTDVASFDYVIVGAGAAGAILANRLSEDGVTTVCLIEAGPRDWHPFLRIPAGFIKVLFNPAFTWQFSSEPTDLTKGRRVPIPQGRTLGGSTAINGLVYNRGLPSDFDAWAEAGNSGWSYADVLPYFKRYERKIGGGDEGFHGRSGELAVTDGDWFHPVCEAFISAAKAHGMPRNADYNGISQLGVGYFQRTIHRGWRQSAARSFLHPVRSRRNLEILTNAQVTEILFEGRRACGVRFARGSNRQTTSRVQARREVIVCAGAVNSAKLLQLSGIGPASLLQRTGITPFVDAPGVGENLRDHYSVRVVAKVKNSITINQLSQGARLAGEIARWVCGRPSALALSPSVVHWFWTSKPGSNRPDLQGVFTPASYREGYVGMLDDYPGMTSGVWQHRPASLGYVRVRSGDPFSDPIVQPNYLRDEQDREVLVSGLRTARQLLRMPELALFFEKETLPGSEVNSDDELLDFAQRVGVSCYHVCGTVRMGGERDPSSVVDHELKVRGLRGLRVADASIMPNIPSANTCAATMMIAEKAADLIRGRSPAPAEPLQARSVAERPSAGAAAV